MRDITRLSQASPILFRIWSGIKKRCAHAVARSCDWTGDLADLVEHQQTCDATNRQRPSNAQNNSSQAATINALAAELSEIRRSGIQKNSSEAASLRSEIAELRSELFGLREQIPQLRSDYSYDRRSVIELSKIIMANLEDKPSHIISGRIYNCVKNCRDAFVKNYSDNPILMTIELPMLLAVCYASDWFTVRQSENILDWISDLSY